MKRISFIAIAYLIFLFASACNTEQNKEVKEQSATAIMQADMAPKFNHKGINSIYPHYIQMKEAMTTGNSSYARKIALLMDKALEHEGMSKEITDAIDRILGTQNLDEQRQAFSFLSDELIKEIDKTGIKDGVVYKAHCPMAFDDDGAYWLTNEEKVRNPYFGDEMLTCGTVEKMN